MPGIYVLEPETFDRIPADVAWSIERSFFPVVHRAWRDVPGLDLPRLLDRYRHAGKIHAGAPRHHGRALLDAAVQRHSPAWPGSRRRRASTKARGSTARSSSTRAASSRRAPSSDPIRCLGATAQVDERREHFRRHRLARHAHRPRGTRDRHDHRPIGRDRPQCSAARRRSRRHARPSRNTADL